MEPKRSRRMMISLLLALAMGLLLWPASPPASGQGIEWKVWMKASPCSASRQEWVTVASENPTYGGGGNFYEVFRGSHKWPTLAEATAEANALRAAPCTFGTGETGTCPKYANYCCSNYSVWQNSETGKFSVIADQFGSAGFGWRFVKGNLCCEDAFALAGLPASCGGGGGRTGMRWRVCETYTGEICGDWTFGADGQGSGQWGGVQADLSITINGRDVIVRRRDRTSSLQAAYRGTLSADGTQVTGLVNWCCDNLGNRSGTWRAQILSGTAVNRDPGNTNKGGGGRGPGGPGGVTDSGGGNSGQRPCTADERAAFAKMAGSFRSYRMNINIGGSCEQATGTWKVTEWCEGVDETYNATTARVNGTLRGRMQGGSLQVSFESPPSPNNSKGSRGTGSCSLNGDGTFSCRGFGCDNKFKSH
jgi:hypothetical protein